MADVPPRRVQFARAVDAFYKLARLAEFLERDLSHASHDPHAGDDVGTVRQLDADFRHGTFGRTHQIRNHVQRATPHAAGQDRLEQRVHLGGVPPIVCRPGIRGIGTADECAILDPRDVVDVAPRVITARMLDGIEANHAAVGDHLRSEVVDLTARTVAPVNGLRPGESRHVVYPGPQNRMRHAIVRSAAATSARSRRRPQKGKDQRNSK